MSRLLAALFALMVVTAAHAETPDVEGPSEPRDDTAALVAEALEHHRRAQKADLVASSVLLGWSVGNIGVGAAGWAIADEPEWVAFHQMSVAWNGINLALAVPTLVGSLRGGAPDTLGGLLRASNQRRIAYAVNTGLDVGWVATGAWLWERGVRTDDPRLIGFGRSMVLQGAFLLVYDVALLAFHGVEAKKLMVSPVLGPSLGIRLTGSF